MHITYREILRKTTITLAFAHSRNQKLSCIKDCRDELDVRRVFQAEKLRTFELGLGGEENSLRSRTGSLYEVHTLSPV